MTDETYYDDETLVKVYVALRNAGIPRRGDAIDAMQNAGILFRERLPHGGPDRISRVRSICQRALTDYVDDGEPVLAQDILDELEQ